MDEVTTLRQHEALVAIRLYSLLDNLINALIPPETEVTPGGYSEDIFDPALSEDEKGDLECSICYNVLKDCRQCEHGHKFCASCIFVWSMQPADFSDKCPVCRCTGDYAVNNEVNGKLNKRHVHCTTEGCNWRGYLGQFQEHNHKLYSERDLVEIERNGPSGSASATGSQTARNQNEPNGAQTQPPGTVATQNAQQVQPASTPATAQPVQESVLPSISDRAQQAPTYASSRVPSGNTRTVPTRPSQAQPTERRTSVTDRQQPRRPGAPTTNQQPHPPAATPRPPTMPRPQQQRTVRRRSSTTVPSPPSTDSAATPPQPLSASTNSSSSRPSSSLPPIASPLSATADTNAADAQTQPAQIRNAPQIPAIGNRRPQPAPPGPSRPIAPTQPASLNAPQQASASTTVGAAQQAPNSSTSQNSSASTVPAPPRRPSSRASSSTSHGSDSTRTSSTTMETSRSNLREVRSRLLASRQQVATILGIIAYEMEGRRRMQEYAMFENEFSRRNHQLGREMDVLRNQLQTVSQVLETIPQQPTGVLANTNAPVFGGLITGAGLQSDSEDDSDDDFLTAIRASAAATQSTAGHQPAAPQTNRGNQPTGRNSTTTGDNTSASNLRNSNAQ